MAEPSIRYPALSGISPARVDADLDCLPLPIRGLGTSSRGQQRDRNPRVSVAPSRPRRTRLIVPSGGVRKTRAHLFRQLLLQQPRHGSREHRFDLCAEVSHHSGLGQKPDHARHPVRDAKVVMTRLLRIAIEPGHQLWRGPPRHVPLGAARQARQVVQYAFEASDGGGARHALQGVDAEADEAGHQVKGLFPAGRAEIAKQSRINVGVRILRLWGRLPAGGKRWMLKMLDDPGDPGEPAMQSRSNRRLRQALD